MTIKAIVSEHGIPKSVATVATLPSKGYVGAIVYCEEDGALYVYDGESYEAVGTENADGATAPTKSVATVAALADLEPAKGDLVFCEADSSVYVYNGSSFAVVAPYTPPANVALTVVADATARDAIQNPAAGTMVFMTSTSSPYVYTGAAWKKITLAND